MIYPIVILGLAAAGGATMGAMRLFERPLPPPLAALHGLLALTGIVLLIYAVMDMAVVPPMMKESLALLCAAAVGGIFAVSYHVRGLKLPLPLLAAHAGAALGGYVLLIISYTGAY